MASKASRHVTKCFFLFCFVLFFFFNAVSKRQGRHTITQRSVFSTRSLAASLFTTFSLEYSFNYVKITQQTLILLASTLLLHIYAIFTLLSRLKQFEHQNGFGMTNHSINLQTNQAIQVLFFYSNNGNEFTQWCNQQSRVIIRLMIA